SDGRCDRLTIDAPPGFGIALVREGSRPGPGGHSDAYGSWAPATTLRVTGPSRAPGRFLTRIGILDPPQSPG
ncbi:MAG: hypothetical protein AAF602_25455, partial [Myxococcota bacterium]